MCPNKKCESEYTGQTKCRMLKRTTQHNKTDEKSHLLIHAKETRHRRIWLKDFEILGKGYKSDFKRRISESLFIKKLKPDLNVQMDTYRRRIPTNIKLTMKKENSPIRKNILSL